MKVKRGTSEKYKEYHPFNPCSQNGFIPSSHSLSFQPLHKYCGLTTFNSFNFIAREFSVIGNLLEIFRVFEGLAKDCISIPCKHIEDRPEKDDVLTVENAVFFQENEELAVLKRSLSSQKTSFSSGKTSCFHLRQPSYHFESAILHENHLKTRKNSAEILFLYSCFLIKEIVMYVFLFYQFDKSTGERKQSFLQDCFFVPASLYSVC